MGLKTHDSKLKYLLTTMTLLITTRDAWSLTESQRAYAQTAPPIVSLDGTQAPSSSHDYLLKRKVYSGSATETYTENNGIDISQIPSSNGVLLQQPHLLSVTKPNAGSRNYYLLAVPMNLFGNFSAITLAAIFNVNVIPSSDIDQPEYSIETVYPSHQYFAAQYDHTNEFGVEVDPQFAPFGGGKIYDKDTRKTSYSYQSPLVFGTVDQTNNRVYWQYFKQGKQRIDQGTVTNFVVFSSKDPISSIDVGVVEFRGRKGLGQQVISGITSEISLGACDENRRSA